MFVGLFIKQIFKLNNDLLTSYNIRVPSGDVR